ncbi:MAG TPA: hypothetical protein VFI33_16440 [Puia sp.]|nr:hypothetical protein [Puia sp.]
MKKLIPLAAIFLILFFTQTTVSSCSKTVTKTDTVVKLVADNSIAKLLMGKQWIVDSLFNGYTATNKGTLVYSRGATNNAQNLDNYIVIMWPDGTQFFANSGTYFTYTYSFRTADSLNLLINNTKADYARIVELNTKLLTIYDSTNSALSYYHYKP